MSATIIRFPDTQHDPQPPATPGAVCPACNGRKYVDVWSPGARCGGGVRCITCDGSGKAAGRTPREPEHPTWTEEFGLSVRIREDHSADEREAAAMLRGIWPNDPNRAAELAAMLDRKQIREEDLREYDVPTGSRVCGECGGVGCVKVGHWHDWQVETCEVCDGVGRVPIAQETASLAPVRFPAVQPAVMAVAS